MAKAASTRSRKQTEEETGAEDNGEEVTTEETPETQPESETQKPADSEKSESAEPELAKLSAKEEELAAQIFCSLVTTPLAVGKDPVWLADAAIHSAIAFGKAIQRRT